MKANEINGYNLIEAVCKQLKATGKTCHDYQILNVIKNLSTYELRQLVSFGDIDSWIRDRTHLTLTPPEK